MLEKPSDPLLHAIEDSLVRDAAAAVVTGIDHLFDGAHYSGGVLAGRQRHLVQVVDARPGLVIGSDDAFHDARQSVALGSDFWVRHGFKPRLKVPSRPRLAAREPVL